MTHVTQLLVLLRSLLVHRNRLAVENIPLRQQLAVLRRSVKRPRIEDSDRVFWILLRRLWKDWSDALVVVKPNTVARWHRKGWKYYWARKPRSRKPERRSRSS